MFVRIQNTPRDYAWGSDGAISRLLGTQPTGRPEAELWLGAHPAAPAEIVDSAVGHDALDAWIAADRPAALGRLTQLPYLLKVLAAGSPLSLQVHPTRAHAALRFAEENAAGLAADAAERNYKDDNHKPELILALEDGFAALCGVRPEAERRAIVAELGLADVIDAGDVRAVFADLLGARDSERVRALVARVVAAAETALRGGPSTAPSAPLGDRVIVAPHVSRSPSGTSAASAVEGPPRVGGSEVTRSPSGVEGPPTSDFTEAYRWVLRLNEQYPGDPGVVLSLLLNLVILHAGEALYLPAGNLHAYLSGLGIEVMAASDNVLRGGLTPKHIDVPELLAVADMNALPLPLVTPENVDGALRYRGEASEFELLIVRGQAEIHLHGPAIVLNLGDAAQLSGAHSSATLGLGEARFVTIDEGRLGVSGEHVVLAQPQATWAEHSA